MNNEKKTDLTRIPKQLNWNPQILFSKFGRESNIIRDLIMLSTNKESKDLFGVISLSVDDFIALGYTRTNLQRVIPEYKDLSKEEINDIVLKKRQELGLDENTGEGLAIELNDEHIKNQYPFVHDHLCITQLDYALYRAHTTEISISKKKSDRIDSWKGRIIEYLRVSDTNKIEKRRYLIKLSPNWISQLYNNYHILDFVDYIALQGENIRIDKINSYRNFYIYFGEIVTQIKFKIQEKQGDSYILSIDQLCHIFGVEIKTPKNRKAYITEALNNIKSLIDDCFSWQYISNGTRYKYFVEFKMPEDILQKFDEKLVAVEKDLFHQKAKSAYMSKIKKKNESYDDIAFYTWLHSVNDIVLKQTLAAEAHQEVHKGRYTQKTLQKEYVGIETLAAIAAHKNITIEEVAKANNYYQDEKGFFKYH